MQPEASGIHPEDNVPDVLPVVEPLTHGLDLGRRGLAAGTRLESNQRITLHLGRYHRVQGAGRLFPFQRERPAAVQTISPL